MAKSAFTQMKTTSLLSDLLAVLIWFPDPPAQVGTAAALSFGEAVIEPPASRQQADTTSSEAHCGLRLHPCLAQHTSGLLSTDAVNTNLCSDLGISEKSFVLHAD